MTRKAFEFTKRSAQYQPEFVQEVLPKVETPKAAGSFTYEQKAIMVGVIIDAVKDISFAVTSVFNKHEETNQSREYTRRVELETKASINEQEILTERVKAEQEEETRRVQLQTHLELQKLQKELIQFREQLTADQDNALRAHVREMDILDNFHKSLDTVRKAYELCSQVMLDAYKRGEHPPQGLTEQLRVCQTFLVNMTRDLAALR